MSGVWLSDADTAISCRGLPHQLIGSGGADWHCLWRLLQIVGLGSYRKAFPMKAAICPACGKDIISLKDGCLTVHKNTSVYQRSDGTSEELGCPCGWEGAADVAEALAAATQPNFSGFTTDPTVRSVKSKPGFFRRLFQPSAAKLVFKRAMVFKLGPQPVEGEAHQAIMKTLEKGPPDEVLVATQVALQQTGKIPSLHLFAASGTIRSLPQADTSAQKSSPNATEMSCHTVILQGGAIYRVCLILYEQAIAPD
jgi:hypothetical protein